MSKEDAEKIHKELREKIREAYSRYRHVYNEPQSEPDEDVNNRFEFRVPSGKQLWDRGGTPNFNKTAETIEFEMV